MAAALLVGLVACGRGGAAGEPHVLRIADPANPTSLDPLLAHDQLTIGYDLLVTQTLIGLNARNRLVPILVTRVPTRRNGDVSPDGTQIVYHLRRGVRFADGTPFTSADVAFTFHAILDPRNPVLSQEAYRRVRSLATPDPYTVVIHLKQRWNAAVAELFAQADFAFGILPAHAFASTDVTRAAWNRHPFGTGPFRVAEWQRGSRIVLEPNAYYRPRPKLHRIVLELIPNPQSALLALASHDLDVAQVAAPQMALARGMQGVRLAVTPLNGEYNLLLQTTAPPTNALRVRRAIAAAIDSRALVRGRAPTLEPADSFLPPVFPWYAPARNGLHARAPGTALTLAFDPAQGDWMATVLQAQLRAAGIAVTLKPFATGLFNAPTGPLRSGRFTAALTGWVGGADPEQSVIFACSQRGQDGSNAMNYCSPRFDALFADQATTPSRARRRADFIAMQRIVRHDVPLVPLAFMRYVEAVSDRVSGFRRNMLFYPVDPASWDAR